MKILGEKCVYKSKYLKVIQREFLNKDKEKEIWDCAEKNDAVLIFPITENKEVILEKIFRVSSEDYIIELPAGLLDKKNESPKAAAKRELLEETGYWAEKVKLIFKFVLSPGVGSQIGFLFFAPSVKPRNGMHTENDEEIKILKIPIERLEGFLTEQRERGTKVDINIWGALALLKNKKLV